MGATAVKERMVSGRPVQCWSDSWEHVLEQYKEGGKEGNLHGSVLEWGREKGEPECLSQITSSSCTDLGEEALDSVALGRGDMAPFTPDHQIPNRSSQTVNISYTCQ